MPRPPVNASDDASLVASALRRDISAQEALVRKYGLHINRLCFRLLGSQEDLDDLVQDTFLQAFRSLNRLKKPEVFREWISAIAVRTGHNLIRRRRLLTRLGLWTATPIDVDEVVDPGAPLEAIFALRSIYRTLDRLPAKVRVTLVLRRVEGRQLEEIAELMGASLSSVKRWLLEADRALSLDRSGVEVPK